MIEGMGGRFDYLDRGILDHSRRLLGYQFIVLAHPEGAPS